jgi:hypothetical protein
MAAHGTRGGAAATRSEAEVGTPLTFSDFRYDQLARLAVLRDAPPDGEEGKSRPIDEWLASLADLPDGVLEAAVAHALRTRVFFPRPAELRADADAAVFQLRPQMAPTLDRDRERALPQPFEVTIPVPGREPIALYITREWKYDCTVCGDTGWAEFWCGPHGAALAPGQRAWLPVQLCNRRREHGAHAYAAPCACRETNPTLLRHAAAQATRYAEEPAAVPRRKR